MRTSQWSYWETPAGMKGTWMGSWMGDGHWLQLSVLLWEWVYSSPPAPPYHLYTPCYALWLRMGEVYSFFPKKSGFKIRTSFTRQASNPRLRWKRKHLSSHRKRSRGGGDKRKEQRTRVMHSEVVWFQSTPQTHPSQSSLSRAQHAALTLHITPAGLQYFDAFCQTEALLKSSLGTIYPKRSLLSFPTC